MLCVYLTLPGVPAIDAVTFGRFITNLNSIVVDEPKINIGNVLNLGTEDKESSVELDVNFLTGHMFATGSTGSGKVNVIYTMLSKLYEEQKVPFLVIELAKGEYKLVFGGIPEVNVFGTNSKHSELLRINPFSFPSDIHVMSILID